MEIQQMLERLLASQEQMITMLNAHNERMMASLGKTDATDLKANPEEKQSIGEHQEIPKEEAAVMPVGEPRMRRNMFHMK
jgi:hypothetical protein